MPETTMGQAEPGIGPLSPSASSSVGLVGGPKAPSEQPFYDPYLYGLEETQRRAARVGVQFVPLHTVLPDDTCSCGHPLCLHPGKHGCTDSKAPAPSFRKSWLCGRLPRPSPGNLGIPADGYLILNVDEAHGGFASLEQVFPQIANLGYPSTWIVGTPGGGLHFWFKLPPDCTLKSSLTFLGPGLSALSGAAVYGMVPPSRGLRGALYTWVSASDVNIAPAPDWMMPIILEADAREARGWHVRMTTKEIAARVHADYCRRHGKLDYDLFADVWEKVARFLEDACIRPESFIKSLFSARCRDGLIPEDLLSPEVLATRDSYVQCYWPKTMEHIYSVAERMLDRYGEGYTLAELRAKFATFSISTWFGMSYLPCAALALYGFPSGVHAKAVANFADIALMELDENDLLGRQLKKQWFVHPEELRCRLAPFVRKEAA